MALDIKSGTVLAKRSSVSIMCIALLDLAKAFGVVFVLYSLVYIG